LLAAPGGGAALMSRCYYKAKCIIVIASEHTPWTPPGMNSDSTDKELIDAYLAGADEAFALLYNRYKRQVYGYLKSFAPGADADDLFQQTWIRVSKKLHRYHCEQKFQAWLFRLARNIALDHLRAVKRKSRYEILPAGEQAPDAIDDREEPWQAMNDEEMRAQLARALAQLSPNQRAVFVMRQKNVSFKIIAEEQGCPIGTVLMRMHYAMKKVRTALQRDGVDEEPRDE